MKTQENINFEIEQTLNSLDNWEPIKTDTFFYTRLSAKLENKNRPRAIAWFYNSPVLRPALIALTIIINIISINLYISNSESSQDQTTDFASLFSEEYQLDQSTSSYMVFNDD